MLKGKQPKECQSSHLLTRHIKSDNSTLFLDPVAVPRIVVSFNGDHAPMIPGGQPSLKMGSVWEMDLVLVAQKLAKDAVSLMKADLEALEEDAFERSFGGKSRRVCDVVYEVMLVNDHVCRTIRGDELFDWPDGGWVTAPDGFAGKAHILAEFNRSCDSLTETVAGLSAEALAGEVSTEHGNTTRFERVQFMALHMWYHSGQLNYVQTLLGDDGWHWG